MLSKDWFKNHSPSQSLPDMPERILQIGEGNFLRGFVDWLIHQLMKQNRFHGKVVIVAPRPSGAKKIQALNAQDGLYTVWLRGMEGNAIVDGKEIIQSVSRALNPYEQWDEFLQCARNPQIDIVTSNTTEAGLSYTKEVYDQSRCPNTYPAKLTAYLYERYLAFQGNEAYGLDVIPCELVENNGYLLRELVIQCAKDWELPVSFLDWVTRHNCFYNTLVDSIVTGFSTDSMTGQSNEMGYDDQLGIIREPYYLWVIQGCERLQAKLDFPAAGLNVRYVDDVSPFRLIKVRILNGAHTALAGLSFLAQMQTVKEAVSDLVIGAFVQELIGSEIIPALVIQAVPEVEAQHFARDVFERFSNPLLRHEIVSLQLNGLSKIKVRLLPTLMDYIQLKGELPKLLTLAIAGQLLFYKNAHDLSARWVIQDNPAHVHAVQEAWKLEETEGLLAGVKGILSLVEVWGQDLRVVEGLTELIVEDIQALRKGILSAVDARLPEQIGR